MMNAEALYPTVRDMIHKITWNFYITYGGEYDDWLGLAHEGFMKACQTYDPSRGMKFSSWCYYCLWTTLKDAQMKKARESLIFVPEEEAPEGSYRQPVGWRLDLEEIRKKLIPEAEKILDYIIDIPEEIRAHATKPPVLIKKIKSFLKEKEGWREEQWERGMRNLKEALIPILS